MEKRHKDFKEYLSKIGLIEKFTNSIARLFLIRDDERPDHTIWYLQNCMDETMDEDFIIKYDNLLNELDENRLFIRNAEKAEARAAEKAKKEADQLQKETERAKKEEERKKKKEAAEKLAQLVEIALNNLTVRGIEIDQSDQANPKLSSKDANKCPIKYEDGTDIKFENGQPTLVANGVILKIKCKDGALIPPPTAWENLKKQGVRIVIDATTSAPLELEFIDTSNEPIKYDDGKDIKFKSNGDPEFSAATTKLSCPGTVKEPISPEEYLKQLGFEPDNPTAPTAFVQTGKTDQLTLENGNAIDIDTSGKIINLEKTDGGFEALKCGGEVYAAVTRWERYQRQGFRIKTGSDGKPALEFKDPSKHPISYETKCIRCDVNGKPVDGKGAELKLKLGGADVTDTDLGDTAKFTKKEIEGVTFWESLVNPIQIGCIDFDQSGEPILVDPNGGIVRLILADGTKMMAATSEVAWKILTDKGITFEEDNAAPKTFKFVSKDTTKALAIKSGKPIQLDISTPILVDYVSGKLLELTYDNADIDWFKVQI